MSDQPATPVVTENPTPATPDKNNTEKKNKKPSRPQNRTPKNKGDGNSKAAAKYSSREPIDHLPDLYRHLSSVSQQLKYTSSLLEKVCTHLNLDITSEIGSLYVNGAGWDSVKDLPPPPSSSKGKGDNSRDDTPHKKRKGAQDGSKKGQEIVQLKSDSKKPAANQQQTKKQQTKSQQQQQQQPHTVDGKQVSTADDVPYTLHKGRTISSIEQTMGLDSSQKKSSAKADTEGDDLFSSISKKKQLLMVDSDDGEFEDDDDMFE